MEMEEYYRLVIDALKMSLSDYVSSGSIDREMLDETLQRLNVELDRRIVNRLPHEELEALIEDVSWVKNDLLFLYE